MLIISILYNTTNTVHSYFLLKFSRSLKCNFSERAPTTCILVFYFVVATLHTIHYFIYIEYTRLVSHKSYD